jgi:hypothetical protein
MPLTKSEREQINKDIERVGEIAGMKMANMVEEMLAPLKAMALSHDQTLYGVNRDNGLNKTVKGLSVWRWIITGGLIVVGSGTFWQLFLK